MELSIQYILYLLSILYRMLEQRREQYYAVNFPLRDGIDDESYQSIFKPVSNTAGFCLAVTMFIELHVYWVEGFTLSQ